MPLHIIREDITRMSVDAIVAAGSAAPGTPAPTGGVNGSIHQKAGARLLAALRRLGGIRAGGAILTDGYDLPCRYVIHTAGPKWQGGGHGEETQLRACYTEVLALAARRQLDTIAFPLISSGRYGYPKAEALRVAVSAIRSFLYGHDMTVYLVVYDKEAFLAGSALFADVTQFIDQHYVDERYVPRSRREADWAFERFADAEEADCAEEPDALCMETCSAAEVMTAPVEETPVPCMPKMKASAPAPGAVPPGLARRLHQLDEGFADMLLRLIDERGMKDSVCYRRANVDRKLFSKIRSVPGYTPKKSTAAAFCVALELSLEETEDLLSRAGYALSRANMFDVILEYFISKGRYDVDEINQVLFAYDQPLLGSNMG